MTERNRGLLRLRFRSSFVRVASFPTGSPRPRPLGQIAVLLEPCLARDAVVFALDQPPFAEGNTQLELDGAENQTFVLEPDAQSERGEEVVLEDVGRVADEPHVEKSEEGNAESERLVGGEEHRFGVEHHAVRTRDARLERFESVFAGEAHDFVAARIAVPSLGVVQREELSDAVAAIDVEVREPLQVDIHGAVVPRAVCPGRCSFPSVKLPMR